MGKQLHAKDSRLGNIFSSSFQTRPPINFNPLCHPPLTTWGQRFAKWRVRLSVQFRCDQLILPEEKLLLWNHSNPKRATDNPLRCMKKSYCSQIWTISNSTTFFLELQREFYDTGRHIAFSSILSFFLSFLFPHVKSAVHDLRFDLLTFLQTSQNLTPFMSDLSPPSQMLIWATFRSLLFHLER